MKILKQSISVILLAVIFLNLSIVSYAEESILNYEVENISMDDIPDNVEPLKFDTVEEADAFFQRCITEFEQENENSSDIYINPNLRATSGTVNVDQYKVGGFVATVHLKLDYSLSTSRGPIESVRPYTQFTGFTMPYSFDVDLIYADILSSGKDVNVQCRGTLNAYLMIQDIIKLYSYNVSLGRIVYLVH